MRYFVFLGAMMAAPLALASSNSPISTPKSTPSIPASTPISSIPAAVSSSSSSSNSTCPYLNNPSCAPAGSASLTKICSRTEAKCTPDYRISCSSSTSANVTQILVGVSSADECESICNKDTRCFGFELANTSMPKTYTCKFFSGMAKEKKGASVVFTKRCSSTQRGTPSSVSVPPLRSSTVSSTLSTITISASPTPSVSGQRSSTGTKKPS